MVWHISWRFPRGRSAYGGAVWKIACQNECSEKAMMDSTLWQKILFTIFWRRRVRRNGFKFMSIARRCAKHRPHFQKGRWRLVHVCPWDFSRFAAQYPHKPCAVNALQWASQMSRLPLAMCHDRRSWLWSLEIGSPHYSRSCASFCAIGLMFWSVCLCRSLAS